ncbi:MAG: acylphosphatase [Gammaproteobacteria bacterium]|jgi:acylphosphatase|nr:acylphosphatase [Gammaproteobacteria bacterium]MDH3821139.1 acylphosphatase [Gammaproteobacteria bacterium]
MATEARLFTVHGRVQGVWFRDSTRREARRLGIAGYAINLPDGNVEVLACGASEALDELADWLQSGPPMASVTRVDVRDSDADAPGGFRIG